MGHGYGFICEKCGYEYRATTGAGMLFPIVYEETVEDIKKGKYGKERQRIMLKEPYAAVAAEEELYICSNCGNWKVAQNLSIYRPKDAEQIAKTEFGIKTAEEWGYVPYVMDDDLESDYELVKTYVHKCGRCRQIMHIADETESGNLKCPKCGTMNEAETEIMWD